MNSLPKTVIRQRRDCDLNPGPSAPESSTLTTRLPSRQVQAGSINYTALSQSQAPVTPHCNYYITICTTQCSQTHGHDCVASCAEASCSQHAGSSRPCGGAARYHVGKRQQLKCNPTHTYTRHTHTDCTTAVTTTGALKKLAHTRLPSVAFRS